LVAHSVDADALHVMMTDVLQLGGESDRRFKPDGALYKLAKGAFASQIMWYKDRCLTEARHVCARMRDAWNTAFRFVDFGDSGGVDAHNMLVKWGGLIRRQFDIDNLHLTAVLSGGGLDNDRIISCFQRFHESNAEQMECIKELIKMHLATTCSVDSLHHELSRMKKVLEEHGQSVAKTGRIVIDLSSPRTTPAKRRRLTDATAAPPMTAAPAAPPMTAAPAAPVPIRRQPHFALYVLPPEGDNLPKLALTFYIEQMYKLATVKTLPKYPRGARGSTGRAIGIFNFFDAMATTEEKQILRERDAGKDERLRIGTRLNDLVVRRLAGFFREENMEIPNVLQTQSMR